MPLPGDVLVGFKIFHLPEDETTARSLRRVWTYLAPILPAAINRFIDDSLEYVPFLKDTLGTERRAYFDLVFHYLEYLFTERACEKHLMAQKERVDYEVKLGLDMRSRVAINQVITDALVDSLRRSRWVSKKTALDITELATRYLALEATGSIAFHYQARVREARSRTSELREAIQLFSEAVKAGRGLAASSVTALGETAGALAELAHRGADEAETAAQAANDTAANVTRVADATEELFAAISNIRQQATESARVAYNAVAHTGETNDTIVSLSEAVNKIGSVVGLISDIAASTNMLALNATIEASRAGDAGRGFAVVAAEVKSLARQTSQATQEIGRQIAMIQDATRRSVEQIGTSTDAITRIANLAEAVAHSVDQQAGATGSISEGVHGAARNATTVAEALRTIEDTVRRARDASRAALDLSDKLAESARNTGVAMESLFEAAAKHEGMRSMKPVTAATK
jgi:methyl-accepting chemotaxis protein